MFLEERSRESAQQKSRPPFLPSHGHVCQIYTNKLGRPSCVYLISTLWSSRAQTLSIYMDFYFVPSAPHYILYLMPVGNFSVVTD